MTCCSDCFSSPYLKDIINRNSLVGDCSYCGTQNVPVYHPRDLSLIFQNILDLYVVDEDEGDYLDKQIEENFPNKIFSGKVRDKRRELLQEILTDDIDSYSDLFNKKVRLSCVSDDDYLKEVYPLHISWSKFAEEIKNTNRFHIKNTLDLSKLESLLKRYVKPIKKGKKYYRGRISDKNGYPKEKMCNPPFHLAKSGRANPFGISYLYVADQLTTTLYETRASLFDYVSIGEFRLNVDIEVISLRGNVYDPVLLAEKEELEDFIVHFPFILKLGEELSKPSRRNDKELDYLPTQYLSEFIKSIGFDGVEYQSSLYSDGYNIALFNPQKLECIKVYVHEIKNIDFEHYLVE